MAGGPGGGPGSGAVTAPDRESEAGNAKAGRTVLNVGRKTFFWRNERWQDSTLTDELEKNVRRVERYSDEYFDLSQRFGKDAAKYLALEENVIVVLDGQAYEF